MLIRPGRSSELHALRQIELAAFETLRDAGAVSGPALATDIDELQSYLDQDLLRVACNDEGSIVGYCGGRVVSRCLHICEIDVHPAWQRQGLGKRLLTTLIELGRTRRLDGATLTTDRLAPFNAPFYASMGFEPIKWEATPPWLRDILDEEVARGMDPSRRLAMILAFNDTQGPTR